MAHDVFISYSTRDANAANAIVNALESNGARCWIAPRDIKPGEIWAGAIMDAITASRVQVVVFSASANGSKDVHNEVDAAIRKGLIVIPFRIEKVSPDGAMEYHLRTRHWLDAMTPDLESGITRLVANVKAILSGQAQPREPFSQPGFESKGATSDSKISIRIPKLTVFLARLWGRHKKKIMIAGGVVAVVLGAKVALGNRTVSGVKFAAVFPGPDGKDATLLITQRRMRFFEAGNAPTPVNQRTYLTKLPSTTTRYVKIELSLDHARPNRVVPLPVSCVIFKSGGGVYANVAQNVRIQPDWEGTYYVLDWGSNAPGTWKPGQYRVDCSYGGKLIARDRFEISGDAALTEGPPDIPSLGAHVVTVKFFESAASSTLPPSQRIYAERFEAHTARHVNIEILTNHAATGRAVEVPMSCTYTRPDGSVLHVTQYNFKIPGTNENTSFATSTGWQNPGNWRPGTYRVSCMHEGRNIASGSFEIVGG